MKSAYMASVAAAILTVGIGAPAFAASCSDEIAALQKETFTGSVNSAGTVATPIAPAAGESTATKPAGASQDMMANSASTTGQTPTQSTSGAGMAPDQTAAANSASSSSQDIPATGAAPAPGTLPGTEATAVMNNATEGKGIAASPAEVDAQQTAQPAETAPKADQLASAGQPPAAATQPTSGGNPVDLRADMLARAEAYQKLGNEGACLNVVEQAKTAQ